MQMKLAWLGVVIAVAAVEAQGPRPRQTFDVILRHGTIVDGTGLPRYSGDVGIRGDRIGAIGDLSRSRAPIDIDATGLFVAPGFINIHSHAVAAALPTAANMLTQGVTTEILNADGGGPTALEEQLSALAAGGLAVNVGAYAGFNSAWAAVVGASDRRPTAAQIDRMRTMLRESLAAGAWGVSAGLDYKPAYFATTDEVVQVVSVAAPWRTNFPNHDRLTPEGGYSSRAGIAETIAIGEQAGLMPVVTHMKVQGREQGRAPEVLASMRAADARGYTTAADAYPYLAGQTSLDALIIPAWAQEGGRDAMLTRFADPPQRARIIAEAEEALNARFNGADGVYLPAPRQQLVDVMREQRTSAGETIVRLLEGGNLSAILRFGSEADLVEVLQHPATAIACDCGASLATRTHPRYYGTFPRVLGRYVRETQALTWEDAVRKMTALPASTIGAIDRGILAAGMAADVTIFDPLTVIDHATYDEPARLSDGIRDVIVNGQIALRDGTPTGVRGGRALTRTAHMPSRPLSLDRERSVAFSGSLATGRISLSVSQKAGARTASGILRLDDAQAGMHLRMAGFGVLQSAEGWASFTGTGRTAARGPERSVTVIVDRADPLDASHAAEILVDVDGTYRMSGRVAGDAVRIGGR
ncbi:MAG TPA: amidohydrolase family protein [Vicinamibacterales bacterium]|jgi:N-acyl-D-aspartate/D-glutamate deacylase|nr:amidohydrolase family protein [Vicinamibacterales bacterium]